MRSKKTIWLAVAITACAGASLVACSSDPDDTGTAQPDASDTTTPDATDASSASDGTVRDSAPDQANPPVKTDSGKSDATVDATTPAVDADSDATVDATVTPDAGPALPNVDAAPDAPPVDAAADSSAAPTGSACAQDQLVQKRLCGYCGTESRICIAGDAGSLVWQDWGGCRGETTMATRCLPGDTRSMSCGNCGSQPQTCQNDCSWQGAACAQPPTAVCKPNTKEYVAGLSCDAGGRVRFCQNDCTFTDFSECLDPTQFDGGTSIPTGAVSIALSTNAGANKVTVNRSLPETAMLPRLGSGACPVTSIATSSTSYDYIVIGNPDAFRTAKVSVWTSPRTGDTTTNIDTVIAAYATRLAPPVSDAERKACTTGVNDGCTAVPSDPTACASSWAGLFNDGSNDRRVTLAPGQTAVIYVASYFIDDAGDYMLSLRTEVLQ